MNEQDLINKINAELPDNKNRQIKAQSVRSVFNAVNDHLKEEYATVSNMEMFGTSAIVGTYDSGKIPTDYSLYDIDKVNKFIVNETASFTTSSSLGSITVTQSEIGSNEIYLIRNTDGVWLKYLLKRQDGKSAYQSYLDTTEDNPVMTEEEWAISFSGQGAVIEGDFRAVNGDKTRKAIDNSFAPLFGLESGTNQLIKTSAPDATIGYNSSTFSAWGGLTQSPIGEEFNSISLWLNAFDTLDVPSQIRVIIKENSHTGNVIFNQVFAWDIDGNEHQNFNVGSINSSVPLWVEYYTDGRVAVAISNPIVGFPEIRYRGDKEVNVTSMSASASGENSPLWCQFFKKTNELSLTEIGKTYFSENIEVDKRIGGYFDYKREVVHTTTENAILQHPNLTFSAWGCSLGVVNKTFNIVRCRVPASTTLPAPNNIKIRIRDEDNTGEVIAEKTVSFSPDENNFIEVKFDTEITVNQEVFVEYLTDGRIAVYITENDVNVGQTNDVRYGANMSLTDDLTSVNTNQPRGLIYYQLIKEDTSVIDLTDEGAEKIAEKIGVIDNEIDLIINLPSQLYAVEGVEKNIYWDNIIFSEINRRDLGIIVRSNRGKTFEDFWTYTPEDYDVGTTTFKLDIYYKETLVGSKEATLHTAAASTSGSIDVMAVGDSTTGGGEYVNTIATDYASNPKMINFKGTLGAAPAKHEGRGGWRWDDYATAGRTFYKFYVSGVTNQPSLAEQTQYTHNGSIYRVMETNITAGSGYISMAKDGANDPLTSGVLTYQSGIGDPTINFSSWELVAGNPFWNAGALDFEDYFTSNAITFSPTGLITFHLGINDVGGASDDSDLQSRLNAIEIYFNSLIAAIRNYSSTIRIGLCLTIAPTMSQDASGANYNNYLNLYRYLINYKNLVKFYLERFDTPEMRANNVYIIDFNCCLDTIYNMERGVRPANARSSINVTAFTNSVHPASGGYQQMGDCLYSFIKNIV